MSGYISKNSGTHHQSLSTLGTFFQRPDSIASKWNTRHVVHQSFKKQKPFPESSLILVSKLDYPISIPTIYLPYHIPTIPYHIPTIFFYIYFLHFKESRNKSKNSLKNPATYTTSSQPQLYPFFHKVETNSGFFLLYINKCLDLSNRGVRSNPLN